MTRLIDANEMLKRLESWNTDDVMDKALYNFTLNRIIEQPNVEAIPIDFIYKLIEKYKAEEDEYLEQKRYGLSLGVMNQRLGLLDLIRLWREEQVKADGTD